MGLDEQTFDALATALFRRLIDAFDEVDPDAVDAETNGESVTVTAANGEKVVVSTQRATRQIWVAGRGEGVHFSYEAGRWLDDRGTGRELLGFIAACVREASGVTVRL